MESVAFGAYHPSTHTSSTSPIAGGSSPSRFSVFIGPNARGEGGGLRDFDLRASECVNGIGENNGVLGAEFGAMLVDIADTPEYGVFSFSVRGGKLSQVEVTNKAFSIARKYLPADI